MTIVLNKIVNDPIVNDPIINDPIINDSIVNDPFINDPIVNDPIVNDPIVNVPIVNDPIIIVSMIRSVHITVHGIVQGVFFRKHTCDTARKLGISGWVRNADDGTVEIEAEAAPEILDRFITWCHRGPERAVVNKVTVTESSFKNFTSFEIKR